MSDRMDQAVLRLSGHIKRMEEQGLAKRVYELDVRGTSGKERLRRGWLENVKNVLPVKGPHI